jgi:hypothetical protein
MAFAAGYDQAAALARYQPPAIGRARTALLVLGRYALGTEVERGIAYQETAHQSAPAARITRMAMITANPTTS